VLTNDPKGWFVNFVGAGTLNLSSEYCFVRSDAPRFLVLMSFRSEGDIMRFGHVETGDEDFYAI
jgi:hypothetical protein